MLSALGSSTEGSCRRGLHQWGSRATCPKGKKEPSKPSYSSQIGQSNKPSHLSRAELVKGHREVTSYILWVPFTGRKWKDWGDHIILRMPHEYGGKKGCMHTHMHMQRHNQHCTSHRVPCTPFLQTSALNQSRDNCLNTDWYYTANSAMGDLLPLMPRQIQLEQNLNTCRFCSLWSTDFK